MLEILLGIETIVGQLLCPTYKHYSPTAESTQWAKKQIGWDAVHSTIQQISSEEILHIRNTDVSKADLALGLMEL